MDSERPIMLYLVTYLDDQDGATEDDFRIERIFSTREKAEAWIGPATKTYQIREHILDDEGPDRPVVFWGAEIRLDTGAPWTGRESREPRVDLKPVGFREESRNFSREGYPAQSTLVWAQSTESYDRALQLARAEREKWLREFRGDNAP